MKVGIIGSRDYGLGSEEQRMLINKVVASMVPDDYVVSGGAKGADTLAEGFARLLNRGRIIHIADWAKHGVAAGPIRNGKIVYDADCILAFYSDKSKSKGTKDCVRQARDSGLPVYEYDAATESYPEWMSTWKDEVKQIIGY